jgi:nucleoid DNA-binding protein
MKLKDMAVIVQNTLGEQLGADEIARLGISVTAIQQALVVLFKEIKTASRYNPVYIKDFGTFKVKRRPPRVVQNHLTKQRPVYVPEVEVPQFSPSKAYKELVSSPKLVD